MNQADNVGANVRRARLYRGMSLEVLAGLIGRSKGWLSMVENGRLRLERRSDITAIADALAVSAVDLLGEPGPVVGARQAGIDVVPLREVLLENTLDDPPDIPVRDIKTLTAEAHGPLHEARRRADYAAVCRTLPGLVAELHVHAAASGEDDQRAALRLLTDLCTCATFTLRHLGQADLAWIAAERAERAALRLGEPTWIGAAALARAHGRPAAALTRALRTVGEAADTLEPHVGDDMTAGQVYGMLHLSAALGAEVGKNTASAQDHIAEAARVAARLGDSESAWQSFGPANVATWQVMVAVEAGEPGRALEYAAAVGPGAPLSRGRRAGVAIETAKAEAMLGHYGQAASSLRRAEKLAPTQVHENPMVRDLVGNMLRRARREAGGRELRGLAWRMGIE
jgi:transcriptional regulator with XRE-family HTH domain